MGSSSDNQSGENEGRGFALTGLIIGLLTGLAVYGLVEYWVDEVEHPRLSLTVLFFIVTAAAATLLLAKSGRLIRGTVFAILIAALLAVPNYHMISATTDPDHNLTEFPTIFWFFIGGPIVAYILVTFARAILDDGAPPQYPSVFFHGLTLPLIATGAKIFALLALVLLTAWAFLLESLGVKFFQDLFQEPWFILPFLGAIGGLSIAMMRAQQSVLGALRFILLLFSRIAMPIMALFSATLLIVFVANGIEPIFDRPYPSAWILALSFAGMLIFNGVYQNGEGPAPSAWLRIATIIALASFPIYAGIAAYAFWLRVSEYGLTPPRIIGLAVTVLAFAYSIVCIAGVATELNWRGKRWMPLVAPLNMMLAGAWVIVLITLSSPIADPWALSAKSQERLILSQKIKAEEFDFGYLKFQLGRHGERVLDRLSNIQNHPEAEAIREGVTKVRTAPTRWEYDNGSTETTAPAVAVPAEEKPAAGPMGLELNPDDNPDNENEELPEG